MILNIIKYIINSILLFIILKLIPTQQLPNSDIYNIVIISLMSLIIIALLNNCISLSLNMTERFNNENQNCNCDNQQIVQEKNDNTIEEPELETTVVESETKTNNLIWGKNYDNDMKYNELPDKMMKPLGQIDTSYTFMPPWKWWPPRARPPACIANKKCDPSPVITQGTPIDVKDWDSSRHVTAGLGMNIAYIEKLNNIYNH